MSTSLRLLPIALAALAALAFTAGCRMTGPPSATEPNLVTVSEQEVDDQVILEIRRAGGEAKYDQILRIMGITRDQHRELLKKEMIEFKERDSNETRSSAPGDGFPDRALLLVIDKSGSVTGWPLDSIKESCIRAAKALGESDYVGVLAFDLKPEWVVPWGKSDRTSLIQASLDQLGAGGGGDISLAMAEALDGFQSHPSARGAKIRHVILISDGDCRSSEWEARVKDLANNGITVSTILILDGTFNANLMHGIARLGNGRLLCTDFEELPILITQEVREAFE